MPQSGVPVTIVTLGGGEGKGGQQYLRYIATLSLLSITLQIITSRAIPPVSASSSMDNLPILQTLEFGPTYKQGGEVAETLENGTSVTIKVNS